jgi:hypothetical protein
MKRSTWCTEHVLLLLMSGGFFIHLVSASRHLRDESSRVGDVVTRPVDAALLLLMAYCAVGLATRYPAFADTYDMRTPHRRLGYWLITGYIVMSLPGHIRFLATGDTGFFDAFPWWFSLGVLVVYVLIVAYVLTLRRLPDPASAPTARRVHRATPSQRPFNVARRVPASMQRR